MLNDAYEHMKMLLNVNKNAKIVIESELRANVRFLALLRQMNAYFLVMNSKRCIIDMDKSKTVFLKRSVFHLGRVKSLLHLSAYLQLFLWGRRLWSLWVGSQTLS